MLAGWLRAGCLAGVLPETGPLYPPVPPPARWPLGQRPQGAARERDIAHCPLPPPGDHRKSTAGAENPPDSRDPLRSPPFTDLYRVLHSSPPTRQPANPSPPPGDLHRERETSPPCPRSTDINRCAPSELSSACRLESSPSSTPAERAPPRSDDDNHTRDPTEQRLHPRLRRPKQHRAGPASHGWKKIAGKCLGDSSGPSAAGGRTRPCRTWRAPWRGIRPASRR